MMRAPHLTARGPAAPTASMTPTTADPASAQTQPRARHLSLSDVSHHFGARAVLHGISLDLAAGELLCLVGPSGCGKSTLLRLIAGLEPVQAGRIDIAGECVAAPQRHVLPEQRDVGLVFQDFALFPHLTLQDNVAFGLGRLPRAERPARAHAMLARVGLADRAADHPHTLSGGQQQRVALARALAPGPRLVLLDEPFSNLDVRLRHRLRHQTLALLRETGTAAILVTHDAEEAMYMADRIALLHAGHIVQMGSPEALYHHPASPFAAEFFGEVNRLQGRVRDGQVHTALGALPAHGLQDHSAADVLVRPEALVLRAEGESGLAARISGHHMLGATTLLALELQPSVDGAAPVRLQAQVASDARWQDGSTVRLAVRPEGCWAFPAQPDEDAQ